MVRGPDSPRARWSEGPIVRGSEDYTVQHVICCITLTTTDHGASIEGHKKIQGTISFHDKIDHFFCTGRSKSNKY